MRGSRNFSLPLYIAIVCALSWPFQIAFVWLGSDARPILLLSMLMAGASTWFAARYVFGDSLAQAGWRFGKFRYYLSGLLLAALLWLFPVLVEQALTSPRIDWSAGLQTAVTLLLTSSLLTLLPAFAEEISWRGYLLPKLLLCYSTRQALLVHGLVTWVWHLPFLLVTGSNLGSDPFLGIALVLAVSLVPAVMHAVVFAWFWARSGSLLVVTFYHVMFDEIRDTLATTIGFGWFAENWQMLVLTVLGLLLIVNTRWLQMPLQRQTR